MTNQEFINVIQNAIGESKGNLDKVFEELRVFTKVADTSLYNDILLQKTKYDKNERSIKLNLIDRVEYDIVYGNVVDFLLNHTIKEIEKLPNVLVQISEKETKKADKSVYISYSYRVDEDTNLAKYIQDLLKSQGKKVFFFEEDTDIDSNWADKINEALNTCDYYILILSQGYMINDMVAEEFRRLKKRKFEPVIIPIRIKMSLRQELPYGFQYAEKAQHFVWDSEKDNDTLNIFLRKIIDESIGYKTNTRGEKKISIEPNLPVSSANPWTGNNTLKSNFYIERSADQKCSQIIFKSYSVLRIKAPRQFGKTTLLSHLIQKAKENDYSTIAIDFQMFAETELNDLDKLLKLICFKSSEQLRLEGKVKEYWDDSIRTQLDNAYRYFDKYILQEHKKPILFAIDKADKLFKYRNNTTDFFGMLRSWHEYAKIGGNDRWKQFSIVITYSTDDIPIEDLNGSFFNVGEEIVLQEFDKEHILDLAKAHGMSWTFEKAELLHKLVGGHPYLVKKALYETSLNNYTFEEIMKSAISDDGPFGDHLSRCFFKISKGKNRDRVNTLKEIIENGQSDNHHECMYLKAIGLIKATQNGFAPSSDLYLNYFQKKLISPAKPKSFFNILINFFKMKT